jgi:hypothetical protein
MKTWCQRVIKSENILWEILLFRRADNKTDIPCVSAQEISSSLQEMPKKKRRNINGIPSCKV